MIRRQVGRTGRDVNAIGLGCMGMSIAYGEPMNEADAVKLLHEALDLGVDHFDTAELYGFGANESLIGAAFHDRRDKAFIATKFGPVADLATRTITGVDGSEANMRRAIEQSLRVLKTDHVDLYYLHRKDQSRPIEETVEAMAKLVKEGKIKAIGLSEVSAETLRRAQAVHPIAAVQSEYSIFTRDIEDDVLPLCQATGVTLVAYSPLGRGMLTGAFSRDHRPTGTDYRAAQSPRFQGEAFEANLALVEEIEKLAAARGAAASQVALAWVLAANPNVVAIPGTTRLANLKSNLGAADVALTAAETAGLDALAAKVAGTRYDARGMTMVNA
ncbi:aryl-alcohol dehydrogenase-like predicted oxidoreductase [Phenylobacterium haematophilum]|uniref:Aryl-alcohol dehydrogenase-like predicted oxidoreductase n=1 Tax=Phenylobacterium haematophilum TaxID=98513 RepID=A0A840A4J8_9CAUL|nr:aldo/keto reductase [Phenylobacterium haematophilum]MBB3893546.1 aryl-alcohol dehydrogenase-like predicted oxidoreductase [Phenylobacterium haematophilum]